MHELKLYQARIINYLNELDLDRDPSGLYDPIDYIMKLGGKRLRPVLTLMACESFGGEVDEALDAASTIEIFHNFTLVHDDIMDEAPLRRGHETVHLKWDTNTAILSGDAMLILAYERLQNYEAQKLKALLTVFNLTALQICEGQQYDVDFETRNDVSIAEYVLMIKYKTAVLLGTALRFGAIVAGASVPDQEFIEEFGIKLGLAFQIQDDYLDAFGDPRSFGKQVGGDIIENKKTFLYLKALELSDKAEELRHLFSTNDTDQGKKVEQVKSIFIECGADVATRKEIERYTAEALAVLDKLSVSDESKDMFKAFGNQLMNRIS